MSRRDETALLHAIASVALRYPETDSMAGRADLVALAGSLPAGRTTAGVRAFLSWWASQEPIALQEAYVETFDVHRRCSLYLSYYLYGDRRQRGQEFVRLKRLYESAGFRLAGRELPDYLPLVLEFAALEPSTGAAVLAESQVGLELLRAALQVSRSPWAAVVDAVCEGLPELDDAGAALVRRLVAEGPPGEQVGLEPFGPPEAMPDAVSGPAPAETAWRAR